MKPTNNHDNHLGRQIPFFARSILFFVSITALFWLPAPAGALEAFPEYACLETNVAFWKDIYTKYPTSSGIIHDSRNLAIIYEVIPLEDPRQTGNRRINRDRIDSAKQKYRNILNRLARNKKPSKPSPDLNRVAALFGPHARRSDFRAASQRLRCQVGQRNRFKDGLIRSGAHLQQIREIFQSLDLPEELIYLPHVESSFNTAAYSKFGAAGIWQFTRATGKRFMTIDYTLDERRDPLTATVAAARLLKENHQKLGSWPLAITAYNHGVAGMLRAQRKMGDYETIFTNYRSRSFKFASRNFYSEFLAAKAVAQNHRQYFGELDLATPQPVHSLKLDGYVAVADLTDHLPIDTVTLQRLNPALRDPVIQGLKHVPRGYRLKLPGTLPEEIVNRAEALLTTVYHAKQKRSHFYTVQRGDTAGSIARRHQVPLTELILANNLNRRATIYVNQTLRLPHAGAHGKVAAPGPAETPLAKGQSSTPQTMAALHTSPSQGQAAPPTDQVSSGLLAQHHPPASSIDLTMVSPDLTVQNRHPLGTMDNGIIVVAAEETLGHFADWLGIRTSQLRRMNDLRMGQPIHAGQRIRIPLESNAHEAFEEKRMEYHQRIEEDFFKAYTVENMVSYPVKAGDNIWTLCRRKFQVPFWLIQKCNADVDFARLRADQTLKIPVVASL